jgi:hypothetical protein
MAVISITAVLVWLAGSALAKSKRKAESMLCQTHLKQWGVALAIYPADVTVALIESSHRSTGSRDQAP